MCMLLGMYKQLVYAFLGFYNKETIYSNSTNKLPSIVLGFDTTNRRFFRKRLRNLTYPKQTRTIKVR